MVELNIATLKGGACIRQVNDALRQAVANILDPNTEPKTKRKVTLTVTLAPNEARNMMDISAVVQAKLTPPSPVCTGATMGVDVKTGEQTAFEVDENEPFAGSPMKRLMDHMEPGDSISFGEGATLTKTADGAVMPQADAWKM